MCSFSIDALMNCLHVRHCEAFRMAKVAYRTKFLSDVELYNKRKQSSGWKKHRNFTLGNTCGFKGK